MRVVALIVFLIFKLYNCNAQSGQLKMTLMQSAKKIVLDELGTPNDVLVFVKVTDKTGSEYFGMTNARFLLGAFQMDNKDYRSTEEALVDRLIQNYSAGYYFKKRKAFKNIPLQFFSDDELLKLESSIEFKETIARYLKALELEQEFWRIRDDRDSLTLFLERNEGFEGPHPQLRTVDDFWKFSQLMWKHDILLVEGHNKYLTVYDKEKFKREFSDWRTSE